MSVITSAPRRSPPPPRPAPRGQQALRQPATPRSPPSTTSPSASARASSPRSWGPSGSGKSTLLHMLAGLDRPTRARCTSATPRSPRSTTRRSPCCAATGSASSSSRSTCCRRMTAAENIVLPMRIAGRKPDDAVGGLDRRDRRPHRPARRTGRRELSGGQQQRVAAARALASRPADRLRRRAHRCPRLAVRRRAARVPPHGGRASSARPSSWSPTTRPRRATPTGCIFLADGHIVDEMHAPTADEVLDYMKHLGA